MIVALAGGVGAARFLKGLVQVANPRELTVIVNTGDDDYFYGLLVCPDLDTVTYNLAGAADEAQGWGLRDDTFNLLNALPRYGYKPWFNMGDRDLATHLHRNLLLKQGHSLSQVTDNIRKAWGIECRLVPMSDDRIATKLVTQNGTLSMQEYFVKRCAADLVKEVLYEGAEVAKPAPGVLEAIASAQGVILCPSNPFLSIQPILAVPGVRSALLKTPARVVGITPIVAGAALKGPADKMMQSLGFDPSAAGVARLYRDFLDCFIVDQQDAHLKLQIEAMGVKVETTDTIMSSLKVSADLARLTVKTLGIAA